MPTVFTHAVVAVAAGLAFRGRREPERFWVWAIACSLLPDADVLAFFLGIPYGHPFGHRGFFHSPFFAVSWGFLVATLAFREVPRFSARWWGFGALFSLITASHGLLDALTDGGMGIALLAPFDQGRYFFPVTPIVVSPIGFKQIPWEWVSVLVRSELLYVWLPACCVVVFGWLVRRWCGTVRAG